MTELLILRTKVQILTRRLEEQKRQYTDLLIQKQGEYVLRRHRKRDAHSKTVSELQRNYEHERAKAQVLEKQNTQLHSEKDEITAKLEKKHALVKRLKSELSLTSQSSFHAVCMYNKGTQRVHNWFP